MDPANAQRFQGPLLYPLSYGGSRASVAPAANTLACSSESRSPAGCRTRTRFERI